MTATIAEPATEFAWFIAREGGRLPLTAAPHSLCEDILAAHPDLHRALSGSEDLAALTGYQQPATTALTEAVEALRAEQERLLARLMRADYLPSMSALSRPEHAELPPDPALAHDADGEPLTLAAPPRPVLALAPLPEDAETATQRRAQDYLRSVGADPAELESLAAEARVTSGEPPQQAPADDGTGDSADGEPDGAAAEDATGPDDAA